MTVPPHFSSYEEYFEQCTAFFEEYQSLYNFANTDVLVKSVLGSIPIDNLNGVDVLNEGFDIRRAAESSVYLSGFFNKLDKLQANYEFIEEHNEEYTTDVPLGPKKKHEILSLAKEIEKLCSRTGCDTVVDFGSGLGYLDQVIFDMTKYNVMGLECNESHYVGAKKRQNKYHTGSAGRVKYIKHRITDQSHINLEGLAAQPHFANQSNLMNLVFNLLARGVLQVCAHKHNYKIKRKKRKAVRVKTIQNDFDSYVQDACTEGFSFIKDTCWEKSISPERLATVPEALFPASTGVIPPVPEPETAEEVPLVSEGEMGAALLRLRGRKTAPGPDGVPGGALVLALGPLESRAQDEWFRKYQIDVNVTKRKVIKFNCLLDYP
ncbi:unnamed protein product, partial [Iphiclides podalirius]